MSLQISINSVRDETIWNVLGWIGSVVICMYLQKIELNHHFEAFYLELNRIVSSLFQALNCLIWYGFYLNDDIKLDLCVRTCLRCDWKCIPLYHRINWKSQHQQTVQCSHGFLLLVYWFAVLCSIVSVCLVVLCMRLNIFLNFSQGNQKCRKSRIKTKSIKIKLAILLFWFNSNEYIQHLRFHLFQTHEINFTNLFLSDSIFSVCCRSDKKFVFATIDIKLCEPPER